MSENLRAPAMPAEEFRELGFLQEVNRRLLHPCGLALQITRAESPGVVVAMGVELWEALLRVAAAEPHPQLYEALREARHFEKGGMWFSAVKDAREDPEGVVFGPGDEAERLRRAASVEAELLKRAAARRALLGGEIIQPVGHRGGAC